MEFGDSASQIHSNMRSNPQLTKENLNKLPNMQGAGASSLLRPIDSISNANTSMARTQIMNSISRKID